MLRGVEMATFGEKLKQLREDAGKSQTELAKEMDISPWTIRNHEQDRRGIPTKLLFQYCKTFGVSSSEFENCTMKMVEKKGK